MYIKKFSFTYKGNDKPTLRQVSYKPCMNNINFIIGSNGSGKSTLIDAITGNLAPGKFTGDVMPISNKDYIYLSQHLPVLGRLKCKKIVQLILGNIYPEINISLSSVRKILDNYSFDFVKDVWDIPYSHLSGGESKFIQLVLFLRSKKNLIIMDEPSAFLDRQNVEYLFDYIQSQVNKTYIIITHDVRDIKFVANSYITLMEKGTIKFSDSNDNLKKEFGDSTDNFLNKFVKY